MSSRIRAIFFRAASLGWSLCDTFLRLGRARARDRHTDERTEVGVRSRDERRDVPLRHSSCPRGSDRGDRRRASRRVRHRVRVRLGPPSGVRRDGGDVRGAARPRGRRARGRGRARPAQRAVSLAARGHVRLVRPRLNPPRTPGVPAGVRGVPLLNLVAYRNLVGVAYTEDEVKAMAEEIEVRERERRARGEALNDTGRRGTRRGAGPRARSPSRRAPHPRPLGPHHASPGRVSGLATRRGRHASGEEKISNRSRRVCVSSGSARAQNLTSLIPRLPAPPSPTGDGRPRRHRRDVRAPR